MFYFRRISGNSMLPVLKNGDYIVAIHYWKIAFKCNDIVVVQHPTFGEIIKRIAKIDNNGDFWLNGDGSDTLSSLTMGAINKKSILGKMIWHIHPK
jgi:nickel-type superoxide dismutase maturation protease